MAKSKVFSKSGALLAALAIGCTGLLNVPIFGHGDLHEQIDALTAKIKTSPDDAQLYLKRAELHRVHGEPAAAKADYDRAERLDPSQKEVHLGRGKLLLGTGAYAEAREELDKFLKAHPDHLDGLVTSARLETKRKRPLEAAADYAKVIRLQRKPEVEYIHEYASALEQAGDAHIPEAIAVLDEGLAKLGPVPTLQLRAIELEVARKDFESALKRLDKVSAGSARKESWLERRGDILLKAGKGEQALHDYKAAIALMEALPARFRGRKATADLEQRLREKVDQVRTAR